MDETAAEVIYRALYVLDDWSRVRQGGNTQHICRNPDASQQLWRRPPSGYVKCNVDAGFFHSENKIRVGMCLRGDDGCFILAKTHWRDTLLTAK